MKPIPILSVDFEAQRNVEHKKLRDEMADSVFKTFSTPDGKKTLLYLDDMTGGSLISTNIHQTVANAAQRDLVTTIHELIERAKQEYDDELVR